ncbi:MAG: hypothetical protein V5A31_05370 [Haloferacaceae archaeon]
MSGDTTGLRTMLLGVQLTLLGVGLAAVGVFDPAVALGFAGTLTVAAGFLHGRSG